MPGVGLIKPKARPKAQAKAIAVSQPKTTPSTPRFGVGDAAPQPVTMTPHIPFQPCLPSDEADTAAGRFRYDYIPSTPTAANPFVEFRIGNRQYQTPAWNWNDTYWWTPPWSSHSWYGWSRDWHWSSWSWSNSDWQSQRWAPESDPTSATPMQVDSTPDIDQWEARWRIQNLIQNLQQNNDTPTPMQVDL